MLLEKLDRYSSGSRPPRKYEVYFHPPPAQGSHGVHRLLRIGRSRRHDLIRGVEDTEWLHVGYR
jgi:hypothetical protein